MILVSLQGIARHLIQDPLVRGDHKEDVREYEPIRGLICTRLGSTTMILIHGGTCLRHARHTEESGPCTRMKAPAREKLK